MDLPKHFSEGPFLTTLRHNRVRVMLLVKAFATSLHHCFFLVDSGISRYFRQVQLSISSEYWKSR